MLIGQFIKRQAKQPNVMTFKTVFLYFSIILFTPFISFCQTTLNKKQFAERNGVYDNDFFRITFYTWTTEEQIKVLRKDQTLLSKSQSETKGYSLFDISLRDSTLKDNPFAQLLQEEQFAKKRFAWTNAWATIMGWKGETYGNQLIKIVLNDSAIIGKFNASDKKEPISFFDLNGQKLTSDYIIKNKNRIAAIYHVNSQKGKRDVWWRNGTYGKKKKKSIESNIPFREYVIINEKMIKSWSYGTSEIKNELESEITLLKEFQKDKEANQKAYNRWQDGWVNLSTEDESSTQRYHSLICFENNYYLFHSKKLQTIINVLQSALKQQTIEIKK